MITRKLFILGVPLIAVLAAVFVSSSNAREACPMPKTAVELKAIGIYSDALGSEVSRQKQMKQAELMSPLRTSLADLFAMERRSSAHCALAIMRHWADNNAFMDNGNFSVRRLRIRVATALNLFAVRLLQEGTVPDQQTLSWLNRLSKRVASEFPIEQPSGRPIANLQLWAAVAASSFLMIEPDETLSRYTEAMWSKGLKQIGPQGYAIGELRRGKRSQGYHQYYYSALEMLSLLRDAQGNIQIDSETAALVRLEERIISGLCRPASFVEEAPVALPRQERPIGENSIAIMHVLGDEDQRIRMEGCGQFSKRKNDVFFAGELDEIQDLIATR